MLLRITVPSGPCWGLFSAICADRVKEIFILLPKYVLHEFLLRNEACDQHVNPIRR